MQKHEGRTYKNIGKRNTNCQRASYRKYCGQRHKKHTNCRRQGWEGFKQSLEPGFWRSGKYFKCKSFKTIRNAQDVEDQEKRQRTYLRAKTRELQTNGQDQWVGSAHRCKSTEQQHGMQTISLQHWLCGETQEEWTRQCFTHGQLLDRPWKRKQQSAGTTWCLDAFTWNGKPVKHDISLRSNLRKVQRGGSPYWFNNFS